jgi:hypothetical protein
MVLRNNGADTAVTYTIAGGATGVFVDTSNSVAIAAGDLLSIQGSGADAIVQFRQMGLRYTADPAPISAALAVTEASDTVSAAGVVQISATAAISEAGDSVSSAGVLPIVATAAIGEAGDSLVSAARLALIAAAAISEADDTLSAFGSDPIDADLSVTEADDTLSADSWVRWPIAAALAVTEAGDVAAAASSSRTWQQVAVNSESWTRVSR